MQYKVSIKRKCYLLSVRLMTVWLTGCVQEEFESTPSPAGNGIRFTLTVPDVNLPSVSSRTMTGAGTAKKEDGEWLTSNVELDGSDGGTGNMQRRKLVFTSGNPGTWEWKITQIQDPDKILLNSETMLETSGVSGDVVYFYFRADAVSGDTATLTLTNTNGDNLPIAVTLTAP